MLRFWLTTFGNNQRYILRGVTIHGTSSRASLSTVHPPMSCSRRYILPGGTLHGASSGESLSTVHHQGSHYLRYIHRGATIYGATSVKPLSTVQPQGSRSRRSNHCEKKGSIYTNKYIEKHVYSKEQHQPIRQIV